MHATAEVEPSARFWRRPMAWLKQNNLSRGFWIYFAAALFFDAGFCIYFFIFNLFLLDLHFREGFIGLVGGAMTLGGVFVMVPAGMLARRIGVRRVLLLCYVFTPLIHVARALWAWAPAQLGLALLGGIALSSGGVCYLPIVARLTTAKNRTTAFTLIFAASLASSAVGGVICGYIPGWLHRVGAVVSPPDLKRIILITCCALALLAVVPAMKLRLPEPRSELERPALNGTSRSPVVSHALIRLLIPLTLWAIVLAAFFPFGNVYLSAYLHLPLNRISFIFSTVQVAQLSLLLATPIVLRALGRLNGVLVIQLLAGVTLGMLACTGRLAAAVPLFLVFNALQWMANPGLYDLFMSGTPDAERESAAAMLMFCNAVVSTLATPCAGVLYARFGYRGPMLGIGLVAVVVAPLSRALFAASRAQVSADKPAYQTANAS